MTAKDILGNKNYLAISYGGYRDTLRDIQPTVAELKDDMKILHAMDIRIIRTYNVQLAQASNILKAIRELKNEDANFEMDSGLALYLNGRHERCYSGKFRERGGNFSNCFSRGTGGNSVFNYRQFEAHDAVHLATRVVERGIGIFSLRMGRRLHKRLHGCGKLCFVRGLLHLEQKKRAKVPTLALTRLTQKHV